MKITYLKLENFAGIYAGTGRKVIEIDFTKKNKNKIILLSGKNGSGKSVIMSCLNCYRETFDERKDLILEGEKGYKEIHYLHNKDKYVIKHFYGTTSAQNKSFISKNGEELNENGGIRTFNQIVEQELKVTPDYFKVGRIGSNVKNFIDLSTADRKKFINKFIPSIDDYLEAFEKAKEKYSDENKKLKALKLKLERFDDFETLKLEKQKLEKLVQESKNQIDKIKEKIVKYETEINNLYDKIINILTENNINFDLNNNSRSIKELINYINSICNEKQKDLDKSQEFINTVYELNKTLEKFTLEELSEKVIILTEKNKSIIESINNLNDSLNSNKLKNIELNNKLTEYDNKINSLSTEDIQPYQEKEKKLNQDIKDLQASLNSIKLDKYVEKVYNNFISNGYVILDNHKVNDFNNYLNWFKNNIIDEFIGLKSNVDGTIIDSYNSKITLEYYLNELTSENEELNNSIDSVKRSIEEKNNEVIKIESDNSFSKILDKRPENCIDDSCLFIAAAIQSKKKKEELPVLKKELEGLKQLYDKYNSDYNELIDKIQYFKGIKRISDDFKKNFSFLEVIDFENKICTEGLIYLNSIEENLKQLVEKTNYINQISEFKEELDNCRNKIYLINDYSKMYELLKNEKEEVKKSIEDNKNEYTDILSEIEELNKKNKINKTKINLFNSTIDSLNTLKNNKFIVENYQNILKSINELYNNYNSTNIELDSIKNDLNKKNQEYENLSFDLNKASRSYILIENTINEINEIEVNFDNYKLIKDSLDPKIGIPLIFMQNYLLDISSKANELLQLSSKDNFQIRFELTDSDFMIQVFKNDGTFLQDINQASQGESALTNVSLSLAMIEKMMNEYNILMLDEVDASLSSTNRRLFLDLVEKQINDLGIEQCFVISHNNEFYSSNVDLILLKDSDVDKTDKDFMNGKNIIFDINDQK